MLRQIIDGKQKLIETLALLEDACRELREEKEKHEQTRLEAAVTRDALIEDRVDELIASDQKQRRRDLWLRGVL